MPSEAHRQVSSPFIPSVVLPPPRLTFRQCLAALSGFMKHHHVLLRAISLPTVDRRTFHCLRHFASATFCCHVNIDVVSEIIPPPPRQSLSRGTSPRDVLDPQHNLGHRPDMNINFVISCVLVQNLFLIGLTWEIRNDSIVFVILVDWGVVL